MRSSAGDAVDRVSVVSSKFLGRTSLTLSSGMPQVITPDQYDSTTKESLWSLEENQEYFSNTGSNWGAVCRQLQKSPSEGFERYSPVANDISSRSNLKRRRSSCADIAVHGLVGTSSKSDPDSPCKQKRHRRTAAEIERGFRCPSPSCHKAYGTEGALKMHIRIKHPSMASPSTVLRSPQVMINTNVMQQLAVPTYFQDDSPNSPTAFSPYSPEDSPGFENSTIPNTLKLEPPSFSSSTPLPSPVPSLKKEIPLEDVNVPSHSLRVPSTPSLHSSAPSLLENWGTSLACSDRIRYSNVPVLMLKVGNWHKGTMFGGDIMAKFLYEERKFVWELYAVTTSVATFFVRMDISFDSVVGVGYETIQDTAALTIDVNCPPTFYHAEIAPHQPVTWRSLAVDASSGDIFTSRRHVLQFGKEAVCQPLIHLFQVEPRLHNLTRSFTDHDSNIYPPQFSIFPTKLNSSLTNLINNISSIANTNVASMANTTTNIANMANTNVASMANTTTLSPRLATNISNYINTHSLPNFSNSSHNFSNTLHGPPNFSNNLHFNNNDNNNKNNNNNNDSIKLSSGGVSQPSPISDGERDSSGLTTTTITTTTTTTTVTRATNNNNNNNTNEDTDDDDRSVSDCYPEKNRLFFGAFNSTADSHTTAQQQQQPTADEIYNANKNYNNKIHKLYQAQKTYKAFGTSDTNFLESSSFLHPHHPHAPGGLMTTKGEQELPTPTTDYSPKADEYNTPEHNYSSATVPMQNVQSHCKCNVDCASAYECACIKGLDSCGPLCGCAHYECGNPLNNDTAFPTQVPSHPQPGLAISMEMEMRPGFEATEIIGMGSGVGMELAFV